MPENGAILTKKLPKTRTIAQAFITDDDGRVLLCELTYKSFWDLPGGVVDPHESPAHAVLREVREELGVEGVIRGLRVVSWLPPWHGWDDALLYVFDVDIPADAAFVLQPKEIHAVHRCDIDQAAGHVAPYTARVIQQTIDAREVGEFGRYLENGERPTWV